MISNQIDKVAWPVADVGRAIQAACDQRGMRKGSPAHNAVSYCRSDNADFDVAVGEVAGVMGVEAEAIRASYSQLPQLICSVAPALLKIETKDGIRLLVLLHATHKSAVVLDPTHVRQELPLHSICSAIGAATEGNAADEIDRLLDATKVRQRESARRGLLNELARDSCLNVGWILRSLPSEPIRNQAKEIGLTRLLVGLFLAQAVHAMLWVTSWWLLGWAVLAGRLDLGWLTAWGLAIVTLIPFRIFVTYLGGLITVRGSVLVKRRLMFGALQLDPSETRRLGVGRLLGRVLESDTFDSSALTGGFLTLTAAIDLVVAATVLAMGTAGLINVLLLVAFLASTFFLSRRYYRQRLAWTDNRLEMTDELVEKMQGHRTRLAQQPRSSWNKEEDARLHSYLQSSQDLDRCYQQVKVLIPRGWSFAAMLALTPFFVFSRPSSVGLGIAIGGILLAYGALANLAQGAEDLSAALIAWQRVKTIWDASPSDTSNRMQPLPMQEHETAGTTVVECKDVSFRYPTRPSTVLQDVNLKIKSGDQILLQGDSGGGKSTLGKLLAAIQTAETGLILCRGIDRQTLGELGWRRRIVLSPQFHDNHVLQGTFAYNVLLGRRWPAREDDLNAATTVCQRLGLGPLLERIPGGIQQMVGETGWQLSQGERSRLFLARAILQDADLVILDEAVGALDPEILREALSYVLDEVSTVLLIAHP